MSWRFRKTFGRGPFRWTLSKGGIGCSWGIPGLRYGVSANGRRHITFSIPGTGISWVKYLGKEPMAFGSSLPPLLSFPPLPPVNPPQIPPPASTKPWWQQPNQP